MQRSQKHCKSIVNQKQSLTNILDVLHIRLFDLSIKSSHVFVACLAPDVESTTTATCFGCSLGVLVHGPAILLPGLGQFADELWASAEAHLPVPSLGRAFHLFGFVFGWGFAGFVWVWFSVVIHVVGWQVCVHPKKRWEEGQVGSWKSAWGACLVIACLPRESLSQKLKEQQAGHRDAWMALKSILQGRAVCDETTHSSSKRGKCVFKWWKVSLAGPQPSKCGDSRML